LSGTAKPRILEKHQEEEPEEREINLLKMREMEEEQGSKSVSADRPRRKALCQRRTGPLQEKEGRRSSNRGTMCVRALCGSWGRITL